jgi:preprotein translocase subunit YajC
MGCTGLVGLLLLLLLLLLLFMVMHHRLQQQQEANLSELMELRTDPGERT